MLVAFLRDDGNDIYVLTKQEGMFGYVFNKSIPKGCVSFTDDVIEALQENVIYKINIKHIKVVRESTGLYPDVNFLNDGYGEEYSIIKMVIDKAVKIRSEAPSAVPVAEPRWYPEPFPYGTTGTMTWEASTTTDGGE